VSIICICLIFTYKGTKNISLLQLFGHFSYVELTLSKRHISDRKSEFKFFSFDDDNKNIPYLCNVYRKEVFTDDPYKSSLMTEVGLH